MAENIPSWIKVKYCESPKKHQIKKLTKIYGLNSICVSGRCPNIHECWNNGEITFMIMGNICTRGCRFCSVKTSARPPPLDPNEPKKVAEAISKLNMKYVVLTSVDRDDLSDYGAEHFAQCIHEIKRKNKEITLEVLIPDFNGEKELLEKICAEKPEVISHNLETVERLTPKVRDSRASYRKSLKVLQNIKNSIKKTGIMVGLGESEEEVVKTMEDAAKTGVKIFTIGQYLRPTKAHLKVEKFIRPEIFQYYREEGEKLGLVVVSGPLVRSSYKALESYKKVLDNCYPPNTREDNRVGQKEE